MNTATEKPTKQRKRSLKRWYFKELLALTCGKEAVFAFTNTRSYLLKNLGENQSGYSARYFHYKSEEHIKWLLKSNSRALKNSDHVKTGEQVHNRWQWLNIFANGPLFLLSYIELGLYRLVDKGRKSSETDRAGKNGPSGFSRDVRLPVKILIAGVFGVLKLPFRILRGLGNLVGGICRRLVIKGKKAKNAKSKEGVKAAQIEAAQPSCYKIVTDQTATRQQTEPQQANVGTITTDTRGEQQNIAALIADLRQKAAAGQLSEHAQYGRQNRAPNTSAG